MSILRSLIFSLPVKKGKIVFNNFNGKGFGCNPKYIALELLADSKRAEYDLVWLTGDDSVAASLPGGIRSVQYGSRRAMLEVATADVIISNVRIGGFFTKGGKKKRTQLYIQTWHGGVGIKKIEADAKGLSQDYIDKAQFDNDAMDVLLTNSNLSNQYFTESYFYRGNVKGLCQLGSPRNDIFFHHSKGLRERVFNEIGLSSDDKVALYVPTFRDYSDGLGEGELIDSDKIIASLKQRFSGGWKFLARLHPNTANIDWLKDSVVNVTKYPDIQELLVIADVVITDYSGVLFDFMLMRKPIFTYAPDVSRYEKERGFFMDLKSLPCPFASDNDGLSDNIISFDFEKYRWQLEIFLDRINVCDDGGASRRCVDLIKHHCMKN